MLTCFHCRKLLNRFAQIPQSRFFQSFTPTLENEEPWTDLERLLCDENKSRVQKLLKKRRQQIEANSEKNNSPKDDRDIGSAVLVPFCTYKGKPFILYTLRSRKLLNHRSDLSFPGGKVDEKDGGNLVTTAVRECCEEVGIARDKIDVWGEFWRDAQYVRTRYLTIPVIANLGPVEELDLKMDNPTFEVQAVIIVSVEELVKGENQFYTCFKMVHPREEVDKYYSPMYIIPEIGKIWGMCANMTTYILPYVYTPFKAKKPFGFFK